MIIFGNKSIDELQEQDLRGLADRHEEESLILEFKENLTSNSKEIAKDISSMANAEGGLLIYGIMEDNNGRATAINWLNASDHFPEKLEQIINSTISPPVNVKIRPISKSDDISKQGYVVYVTKSSKLHMVIKGNDNCYYIRSGRTIREMVPSEIELIFKEIFRKEEKQKNILEELEKDYVHFLKVDLENNPHLAFILAADDLSRKNLQGDLYNIIKSGVHPIYGSPSKSYRQSVVVSNYLPTSQNYNKKVVIVHIDGSIELRITEQNTNTFYVKKHGKDLAAFLGWCIEIYKKLNYYGGFNLTLNLRKFTYFVGTGTMAVPDGTFKFRGDNIVEKTDFSPVVILSEDEVKEKITDLIQRIGSYADISWDAPYEELKDLLKNNSLSNLITFSFY